MVEQFYQKASEFLDKIFSEMDSSGIDIGTWDIDHICFRTETIARYEQLKKEFLSIGKLLIESDVNGRSISTFELTKPIQWKDTSIALVELPAPKAGKPTREGFEHIEVVAPVPLEELQNRYSNLQIDERGLKKDFNRELEIQLPSGAIKFHNLSLASVIEFEKNEAVHRATLKCGVLKLLEPYGPLVAGTFPLGIAVEKSDVDVVCATLDAVALKMFLETTYGNAEDFEAHYKLRTGKPILVVRFRCDGVLFEVFAQELPSVMQSAYKHYLIEERFLKLGGEKFRAAIIELRRGGMKTEPAFATALKLNGDAYEELLKFDGASEKEFRSALNHAGFQTI